MFKVAQLGAGRMGPIQARNAAASQTGHAARVRSLALAVRTGQPVQL